MNATSACELKYKGLSEEDQRRMSDEIAGILKRSIEASKDRLKEEVKKAVDHLELTVGVWTDWVEENSSDYDLFNALKKQIWEAMLKTNPSEIGEWSMRELVESWQNKFPTEWAKCVGEEAAREMKQLQESLDFERRMNRRY